MIDAKNIAVCRNALKSHLTEVHIMHFDIFIGGVEDVRGRTRLS